MASRTSEAMPHKVLPLAVVTVAIGLLILSRAGGSRGIAERLRAVSQSLSNGVKPVRKEGAAAEPRKVRRNGPTEPMAGYGA
jgi:hypothetical protein